MSRFQRTTATPKRTINSAAAGHANRRRVRNGAVRVRDESSATRFGTAARASTKSRQLGQRLFGAFARARATTGLSVEERRLYNAARDWHEQNPMIGTRGVRLGVVKPGLYAMQVRALVEAAAERRQAGGKPKVEVMIPLTVTREELGRKTIDGVDVVGSRGVTTLERRGYGK